MSVVSIDDGAGARESWASEAGADADSQSPEPEVGELIGRSRLEDGGLRPTAWPEEYSGVKWFTSGTDSFSSRPPLLIEALDPALFPRVV